MSPDRNALARDGKDLSCVTLIVTDQRGQMAPRSINAIHFEVTGPGEIVATDNGDATDMTAFPSHDRNAFHGLALAIVRAKQGEKGAIFVKAHAEGFKDATTKIVAK